MGSGLLRKRSYPPMGAIPQHTAGSSGSSTRGAAKDRACQTEPNLLKLCHASSRVWTEIRGAVRAIRRSSFSTSSQGTTVLDCAVGRSPAPSTKGKDHHFEEASEKTCHGPQKSMDSTLKDFGPASSNTVVVHDSTLGHKPSLQLLADPIPFVPSSEGSSVLSSNPSSKLFNLEKASTKTSVDSHSSLPSKDSHGPERRFPRRYPRTRSSPEGPGLGTIDETSMDHAQPTIATVEKAAAAKAYLEIYFNELLHKPKTRSLRQQHMESYLYYNPHLNSNQRAAVRQAFFYRESCHLRESRVVKSKGERSVGNKEYDYGNRYESVKVLGKGSFGVVRLVREKSFFGDSCAKQVYAMKVIRKSDMLRSSQEGHLRAERDFLVASEGSDWIVPLVASFQDLTNLYLVMEYMPGGDFLGLLIRENVLHESVARFYVAEMILAVEEAHRLKCIHRDIKPDNFLISASGHLKLSDFGLAFDGHWSHDSSYYNCHRYSLLRNLGINVNGDCTDQKESRNIQTQLKWAQSLMSGLERHEKHGISKDKSLADLLVWRNEYSNRTAANSVVGTSQYMAPEGRQKTKENIVEHKKSFFFPQRPQVSNRCKSLIYHLIQEKEARLCSRHYRLKDREEPNGGSPNESLDFYVFPDDAEDIKAHRWFKDVPWGSMQTLTPPFVPHVHGADDTHYFEESDGIEDWSITSGSVASPSPKEVRSLLCDFRSEVQELAIKLVAEVLDSAKLRQRDREINASPGLASEEKDVLKRFVRIYGKKEPKRPRDRLLRDDNIKDIVIDVRKKTAFMGYAWRRMAPGGYVVPF
ncbi:kinase-like domain-containing protein [Stachybotrys elegans]|uniref:non-specific serine/threonine protein kinase n=1 Tax=Stachybotrys elegans TaxID=80388 RepID=A0A8K0T1Y7_9HYPO|nr:kinase-like domain-containing protein [Stachybotrys elegans]